jgi:hypothetical protein
MGLDGQSFSSIFSTHPPVDKRIKILHSMGSASLSDYNNAYRQITGENILSEENLPRAEELALRGISDKDRFDEKKQTREANDILMKSHRYTFFSCPCGLKFKLPPGYQNPSIRCPRCGKIHENRKN